MKAMTTRTVDARDAIEHLPDGATLIIHDLDWDQYERLLKDLTDRPHLRVSYDCGNLEIMSPLPEREEYAEFIDDLVPLVADRLNLRLEKRGKATWKRRRLARGVEPDGCYYIANADRIIGRRTIDLEHDPPPDIVLEIDITNESLRKFPIYAALSVPEVWRYDGRTMWFYRLSGDSYHEIEESQFLPGLKPPMLAEAVEQSKTDGQTAARHAFREKLQRS